MNTNERTAEDWGRVAVSLPGWRWMPGMYDGGRRQAILAVGLTGSISSVFPTRPGVKSGRWPDPDDPATAGCLLALLGSLTHGSRAFYYEPEGDWSARVLDRPTGRVIECAGGWQPSLGRACIAAAEALGRWPGGEG